MSRIQVITSLISDTCCICLEKRILFINVFSAMKLNFVRDVIKNCESTVEEDHVVQHVEKQVG